MAVLYGFAHVVNRNYAENAAKETLKTADQNSLDLGATLNQFGDRVQFGARGVVQCYGDYELIYTDEGVFGVGGKTRTVDRKLEFGVEARCG